MKINNVRILNGEGQLYWNTVKAKPDESLIEANITMTLSWEEYQKLLNPTEAMGPDKTGL